MTVTIKVCLRTSAEIYGSKPTRSRFCLENPDQKKSDLIQSGISGVLGPMNSPGISGLESSNEFFSVSLC